VTELSGYVLETLWEGSEFALYRGRQAGNAVPILLRAPLSEQQTAASLRWLQHEYELASLLDSAWAVRPLALARHDGRMALVLEDPGGEPLARLLERPLELTRFLQIAISFAAALGEFHRRGLIHKNIKPGNVLVDAAGSVRLTGFGMASRLPRERQAPAPPEIITGTFAYMAPEQTGRMNRSIDTRSDLYALGVTLYEMLTGALPFAATDRMEWIHCHIARRPPPPSERMSGIPGPVEAIVLKLLAKSAADRYQTAAGLEADLRACLTAWEAYGRIDPFPLGRSDTSDRLAVPETLYGREAEIDTLVAAFDRVVSHGATELVLVAGHAGIGKSSLVHELHKELVPARGVLAAGKFDQYKRNIPYATLAGALQGLVDQILGKSDAEMNAWRSALLEALGPNGQLMINLIPQLALVVGEQPPVSELPPQDQQARFQWVFRRFLGVFARPGHPLALFLDDLQWADSATLDLIEQLVPHPDVRHLLLVGAYRDNEVGPAHPLTQRLATIRGAGGRVQEILLAPLRPHDVQRLLADALHAEPGRVRPLADLVFEKTAGNPFFTIQFLLALAEEALVAFDPGKAAWTWNLSGIRAKGFTDNVVDLMAAKLGRLPDPTQTALGQLACLGSVAKTSTLSLVHGQAEDAIHTALWEAVRAGLLLRSDDTYTFLHDRIQEAAYALIPAAERAMAHLRIGRLLAAQTTPEKLEEGIFDIVNQFDRGAALITTEQEREQVARLNLVAGKRAQAATAYASALQYFAAGRVLLAESAWERRYRLAFDLELGLGECEYLTGELAAAEERLSMLSGRARSIVDRAAVTCLQLNLYATLGKGERAVAVGLDYLRRTDEEWPLHATVEEVRQDHDRLWRLLGSRSIEALLDLPLMTDPDRRATMDVLTAFASLALLTDENLFRLVVGRMVILSLEHGNSDGSCLAYAWLGGVLGTYFGDYRAGFRFGRLGLDLVDKRGLDRFKARVYLVFGAHVAHWTQPLTAGRGFLRRAFDAAEETGDHTFAAYSCLDQITNHLAAGDPLGEVEREAEHALEFARNLQFGLVGDVVTAQLTLIRTLRGPASDLDAMHDAGSDEDGLEPDPRSNARLANAWIRRLQACVFANAHASGSVAAAKAAALLWRVPTQFELAEYHFYAALARAGRCETAPAEERPQLLKAVAAHRDQIELWAKHCPATFANRAALVGAEMARLEGRELEAMRLYDEATRSAHAHGFVQNEGLANELAARFYAARGFATIAEAYFGKARSCYLRWGADAKVRQFDETYPHLRQEPASARSDATIGTPVESLDLGTVVKVSQAISGEMDLKKLIDILMVTALEHAGADRGLLILPRGDELRIEAEATTVRDTIEVDLRQAPVAPADLPGSVLRYVTRTHETFLLGDTADESPFADDDYIRQERCRSMLCLPLIRQAQLIGVLYLENSLISHVFTPARIAVLKLLASQSAISLENARLYSDLQRADAYLTEAQRLSRTGSFGWHFSSGKIVWSQEMFQIFGVDPATRPTLEMIIQRIHPDDVEIVQRAIHRAPRDQADWDFEHRLLMPDRSVKFLRVVAHPLRGEAGDLELVGAVMDVTATKLSQEALNKAQAELAHVARVMTLGELASIAHEINQPLAAIVTNGEASLRWLTRSPPEIDEVRSGLQRMIGDAGRASDLIHHIRTLSRNVEPERVPLDLNQVVDEVVKLVDREVANNGVSLRLDLATDLAHVLGDRVQLQQVIINLVINGIQAMAAVDERSRELLVRSQQSAGDQALVAVQDSGVGIDPENVERLFAPFFTTKANGMGLGLSICRSIVEAHGGRLWASRNAGAGATFQFTLPSQREGTGEAAIG
jgi:predicted ATPase/signal transduction histidine kinase